MSFLTRGITSSANSVTFFTAFQLRHIADMQVQNDLAALRLLAPERDAFGNLVWRAEHRSVDRGKTFPGHFGLLDSSGLQAFP